MDIARLYYPSLLVVGLVLGFDGLRMSGAESGILVAGLGTLAGGLLMAGGSAYALAVGQEPEVGDRVVLLTVGAAVLVVAGSLLRFL